MDGEGDKGREFETNTKMNVDDSECDDLTRSVKCNSPTLLTDMEEEDEEGTK